MGRGLSDDMGENTRDSRFASNHATVHDILRVLFHNVRRYLTHTDLVRIHAQPRW